MDLLEVLLELGKTIRGRYKSKNVYDWNKQKEDEQMALKPVVCAENLFSES